MLSKAFEGGFAYFGGSSGSTPLTSGVAVNLVAVLGESSIEIIKPLLKNSATSFPIANNRNGSGLLNSYRALMVAKKIKLICSTDKVCMQKEVQNMNNYEFNSSSEVTKSAKEEVFAEIPSCKQNQASAYKINSCKLKSPINELRKDFLLTQNQSTGEILSCVYNSLGFSKNAQFYKLYSQGGSKKVRTSLMTDDEFFRHLHYMDSITDEEVVQRLKSIHSVALKSRENLDYATSIRGAMYSLSYRPLTSQLKLAISEFINNIQDFNTVEEYAEELMIAPILKDRDVGIYILEEILKQKKAKNDEIHNIVCFEKLILNQNSLYDIAKANGFYTADKFITRDQCVENGKNNKWLSKEYK